jgi:molybdate transport system regulatory protein
MKETPNHIDSLQHIIDTTAMRVNGSLWIEKEGRRFFGPGPAELLEYIELTGSISQAAKKMQMSYKKAWELVNNLNAMSAHPMVITVTGGEKGGVALFLHSVIYFKT